MILKKDPQLRMQRVNIRYFSNILGLENKLFIALKIILHRIRIL